MTVVFGSFPKCIVRCAIWPTASAMRLAATEGIESDVFELFALFHDSRHLNDERDPEHGARGAALSSSKVKLVSFSPEESVGLHVDIIVPGDKTAIGALKD